MLRRSHKKSRGGCLECKRRHVKCDEGRPVCVLCTKSERACNYPSQTAPKNLSPSESSSDERSTSPNNDLRPSDHLGQGVVDVTQVNALTSASLSKAKSLENLSINSQCPTIDEPINLNHMELLIHFIIDKDMFNLGDNLDNHASGMSLGLQTALDSPYFLHALLAFSARHLAYLHPERSAFYLHQAITLQTRAVSLFNSVWTEVNRSNCVAILLFSTALGHHLLADTLARRDRGGLDAFVTHYTQCIEMHRGIYTIAISAWPLLMESWLEPILSLSAGFTSRPPKGNQCQRIRELVDGADNLEEKGKEACRLAIQYLQVGFDAVLAEREQCNRYQMIFSWTMLASPELTNLLKAKQPVVLVLLAYYALLLHYGRKMWQVGDAGRYVLDLIVDYLGPEWDFWLRYPRERVLEDI